MRTNWIVLHVNSDNIKYPDTFGKEHISKEIKNFTGNKNITVNIYRTQPHDLMMYGYICIGFNDFMLKRKSWLYYTNLFSPNKYEKNDKIILKYFHELQNSLMKRI